MSHEDRFDLDREERIARVLRRQPRDRSVPPYAAVESRLRSRVPAPVAVLAGAAVIVLAAVLGAALAERRGGVGEPSPSASAPPGTASASPSLTATPPATTLTPTPSASPTPTPIALPSHAEISAPSRDVVWALVGDLPRRLFVSTDRGNTWQERTIPEAAQDLQVSFISEREGWAMHSPATECDTNFVRLWHTSDGANTWNELPQTPALRERCKGSLSFINESAGSMAVWGANEPPGTLQTTDGGRTWRAIPIPDPPGFTPEIGEAIIAGLVRQFGTALFVDAVAPISDPARHFVYVWSDNAPGWSYLAEVPNARDAFVFVGGRGGGDLRWLLISGPGGSQESTDSGQTWHPFETDYQQAAPVAPVITFADGSVGYATVRGAIQRTTDGGRHWEAIETPGT